jgi:hypothetical protein
MDVVLIEARQQRGMQIAATKRIKHIVGEKWLVPSQSGSGKYVVDMEARQCTCPDHATNLVKCKHMWSVEIARTRTTTATDGTVTMITEKLRLTYPQHWPTYNLAQTTMKGRVRVLLRTLCNGIITPPQQGRGRRRHELSDIVYAAAMVPPPRN